ncbi:hypothetical protein BBB02_05465 [Wolbachia endosymbiont of Bemisia tabaci]|uniref:hypothetical protein n=1 Tax=Wolbachia endosymbiont of Bemisia tabaci TaxID=215173 RepID=UPI000FD15C18|nr:hypothetical protein [Wolbachia endosymbiont of Bemisia tabaci]AZU37891.1 hypothetical protein BBB02_05465 [Wolbachia endosymbiont of Bemisia tabaci]
MHFNLEPGGAFCDGKNKLVTVKINDEEKINLPYTGVLNLYLLAYPPIQGVLNKLCQTTF